MNRRAFFALVLGVPLLPAAYIASKTYSPWARAIYLGAWLRTGAHGGIDIVYPWPHAGNIYLDARDNYATAATYPNSMRIAMDAFRRENSRISNNVDHGRMLNFSENWHDPKGVQ